ncbi:TATA box-binding protein-associated factor RNA polymerase I subunit B [Orchesella cincta]|uniref:TATA box-binding protein-associated factor RNA polymerase I subunit B n=1 Tax=Orchesella cincta TaxID=48709 RepID=A0A1D2MG22_ORCCI|nr:TATA box-binding protein-associated factor RNA polymerase I subunit B [Orchesella cincta]
MDFETIQDDQGPATQETCFICGTSNFYSEGGFYYCSMCNTQSQTIRLYAEEEYNPTRSFAARAQVLRDKKEKVQKKVTEKEFMSTWELYNVLLKHLANQLVNIGFPEIVKTKIFQFYTAFLIRRKVVFVSKWNPKTKSTVTCGEPPINLYSLYGIKPIVRKPPITKKLEPTQKVAIADRHMDYYRFSVKKRLIAVEKKKAMEREYKAKATELAEEDAVFDEVAEKLEEETKQVKKQKYPRLAVTPGVRKLRKGGLMKGRGTGMIRNTLAQENCEIDRNYTAARRILEYERFSFKTALILIFVALRQLGFPLVFSDILRLVYVGVLSFNNVNLGFYEDNKALVQRCRQFYRSIHKYFSLRSSGIMIECFVKYLGIRNFNFPKMKEIVPKYCDDFVLPREFECLINLYNHMFTFDDYVNYDWKLNLKHFKSIPEVFVLTHILVVLKMLFGLDDRTEKFQSNFARLVNSVIKEEVEKRNWEMEEWTELFVIEDWFGYLQRRRELVKTEIFSSHLYAPNKPPNLTKLNNLLGPSAPEAESEDEDNSRRHKGTRKAIRECTKLFERMFKESLSSESGQPDIPTVKPYVPLPLPTQSVVDQYLKNYPAVHDPSFKKEFFEADFVKKRIDFIWNPRKYVKLLKSRGYTVKIIKGDAMNNNGQFELPEGVDETKVIPLFQPYKNFDEFVPNNKEEWSHSLKFLLESAEEITSKCLESSGPANTIEFHRMMNWFGDMYIKACLSGLVPLMSRDDVSEDEEHSSDSDSSMQDL